MCTYLIKKIRKKFEKKNIDLKIVILCRGKTAQSPHPPFFLLLSASRSDLPNTHTHYAVRPPSTAKNMHGIHEEVHALDVSGETSASCTVLSIEPASLHEIPNPKASILRDQIRHFPRREHGEETCTSIPMSDALAQHGDTHVFTFGRQMDAHDCGSRHSTRADGIHGIGQNMHETAKETGHMFCEKRV